MKVILDETLKTKGKSQYWLAKETGIAASTINNLCNGKTDRISFNVIDRICDALECDVNDIIISEYSLGKLTPSHYGRLFQRINKDDE